MKTPSFNNYWSQNNDSDYRFNDNFQFVLGSNNSASRNIREYTDETILAEIDLAYGLMVIGCLMGSLVTGN